MDNPVIKNALEGLEAFISKDDYRGWDAFDGLNSSLFQKTPFSKSRFFRLAWIQFFKKSPINFRKWVGVPVGYNPKALALFISGYINLYSQSNDPSYLIKAESIYKVLIELVSDQFSGLGWGYNFDWQARAFFVPKYKPNMVCSVFAGNALLDLYTATNNDEYLEKARLVSKFILDTLKLYETDNELCFGYIPGENTVVHNANLLGAAYLARLYSISKDEELKKQSNCSIRFSANAQSNDGSWVYGERKHHQWVDNFHTGYNLTSIFQYQNYCNDIEFESNIRLGLEYHLKNHFTQEILPKYSNIALYPLDIHCFSQSLISSVILVDYWPDVLNFRKAILNNLFNLMYNRSAGYFYYQRLKHYAIKIPYIRWSHAWMFFTLSLLLKNGIDERI